MIGANLYSKSFPCLGYNCSQMIGAYPCPHCGFQPKPKDTVIDGERQYAK